MKVLILENSDLAPNKIKQFCVEFCKGVNNITVANTFKEMKLLHSKNNYDVLFLDIDKESKEAFKFIESIKASSIHVVVTSSETNQMIEAFKYKIVGYLKKPFQKEEFKTAVNKILKLREMSTLTDFEDYTHFKNLIENGQINRIALTTLDGYVIVHYDDIIRCEANGNYTSVYFHDGSFLMLTKTLKHYASKLEEHGFFRVHKTHLVNMNYIRSYVKGKNSYVELIDGSNIEVSSRKKQTLVEILCE